MKDTVRILLLSIAVFGFSANAMHAQSRSLGAEFSYSEMNLSYQHAIAEKTYVEINAGLVMSQVIPGKSEFPGIRGDFIYEFLLGDKPEGGRKKLTWVAGPGISAGFAGNADNEFGITVGLCAEFGFEYSFDVPVILSLSVNPLLAGHLRREKDIFNFDLWTEGLIYSFIPRIGIRYRF